MMRIMQLKIPVVPILDIKLYTSNFRCGAPATAWGHELFWGRNSDM